MKLKKPENHPMSDKLFKHIPNKLKQYASMIFNSSKCKKMSHGSCNIMRIITFARGENWRRNHLRSLKKNHK
jgi:S-adenosylmethionine:tRNA-ribosyltransferase-isomerase (queuine synthetase)